jgi:hypothetical protein
MVHKGETLKPRTGLHDREGWRICLHVWVLDIGPFVRGQYMCALRRWLAHGAPHQALMHSRFNSSSTNVAIEISAIVHGVRAANTWTRRQATVASQSNPAPSSVGASAIIHRCHCHTMLENTQPVMCRPHVSSFKLVSLRDDAQVVHRCHQYSPRS